MILKYYPETDSLYIEFSEKSSVDSIEVKSGVILDFDSEGKLVGIDIDNASSFVDLSFLQAQSMPTEKVELIK